MTRTERPSRRDSNTSLRGKHLETLVCNEWIPHGPLLCSDPSPTRCQSFESQTVSQDSWANWRSISQNLPLRVSAMCRSWRGWQCCLRLHEIRDRTCRGEHQVGGGGGLGRVAFTRVLPVNPDGETKLISA